MKKIRWQCFRGAGMQNITCIVQIAINKRGCPFGTASQIKIVLVKLIPV
jgi:hypothetical protein